MGLCCVCMRSVIVWGSPLGLSLDIGKEYIIIGCGGSTPSLDYTIIIGLHHHHRPTYRTTPSKTSWDYTIIIGGHHHWPTPTRTSGDYTIIME